MDSSTRISDLPMMNGMGMSNGSNGMSMGNNGNGNGMGMGNNGMGNGMSPPIQINLQDALVAHPTMGGPQMMSNPAGGYMPMNVHPNPYGNQPPTQTAGMMPMPQYNMQPKLNANSFHFQNEMPTGDQSYPLPSRDIPMDTTALTQDEHVTANYIPRSDKYLPPEIELDETAMKRRYAREKQVNDVFVDMQKPVIYALLFLFLQLPMVNALMFKYGKMFYTGDGVMTMGGLVFKSVVFGCTVYGFDYLMAQL